MTWRAPTAGRRCAGLEAHGGEDAVDGVAGEDRRDGLQRAEAAIRAGAHVDVVDPAQEIRPAQAWPGRGHIRSTGRSRRVGAAWRAAVVPGARGSGRLRDDPRARHQCREALHEVDRRHLQTGGAVAPGCLEFERHARGAVSAQLIVGEGRAGDIAAQPGEPVTVIGPAARRRMQTEAGDLDAERPAFAPTRGAEAAADRRDAAAGMRAGGDAIGRRG